MSVRSHVEKIRNNLSGSLLKNGIYLVLKNGMGAALGFVFWLVAARLMSQTAVGLSSAIISVIRLLALISLVGLEITVVRYFPDVKNKFGFINTISLIVVINSILFSVVYTLVQNILTPKLDLVTEFPVLPLVFLSVSLTAFSDFHSKGAFVALRRTEFSFFQQLSTILRIPLLVTTFVSEVFVIILGYSFGMLASSIMALSIILRRQDRGENLLIHPSAVPRSALKYTSINYLSRILEEIPPLVLPIMVVGVLGSQSNAKFYIAWSISFVFILIPRAISQALFAEGTNESTDYDFYKYAIITFGLLIPALTILFFIAPYLLRIFGADYVPATNLLLLLSTSSIPFAISVAIVTDCRVRDGLKEIIVIYACLDIVTLLLSVHLMSSVGLIGVGYAWLIANCITAIVAYYVYYTK